MAALVKTRCVLDDVEPALDHLAQSSSGPQSLDPWTLAQVSCRPLQHSPDLPREVGVYVQSSKHLAETWNLFGVISSFL